MRRAPPARYDDGVKRAFRVGGVVVLVGLIAASVASCLDPTQITLDVRTDVRCELVRGLTIVGGRPGAVEGAPPTTETTRCLPSGEIGTLVATPKETKSDNVAFKVVMGVDRPVADCKSEDGYKGCIIQRRQLAFVPRTPITLPVYMLLVCVGVPCDENSTCAANGKCVPAKITDPERCVRPSVPTTARAT